jgi:hypothetical protein
MATSLAAELDHVQCAHDMRVRCERKQHRKFGVTGERTGQQRLDGTSTTLPTATRRSR